VGERPRGRPDRVTGLDAAEESLIAVVQTPVVSEVYEIRTPENVRFYFERAGVASRALAWAIDVGVMALLIQTAVIIFSLTGLVLGELASALLLVVIFLVQWWYGALAEWLLSGRTLGKWALGLRTMDATGLPLGLYQATVRNLLRVVDFLPGLYLVGGVCALIDDKGRRLGDIAASTLVVRERRGRLPARLLSDLETRPGTLDLGMAAARISRAERDAVFALCQQRDSLPLATRAELFEQLADLLAQRHGLTRPQHLSAEKLVLHVAAAMTRGQPKAPARRLERAASG